MRPVLLVTTIGGRRLVARRCERAARAGVRAGMDLSQARLLLASPSPERRDGRRHEQRRGRRPETKHGPKHGRRPERGLFRRHDRTRARGGRGSAPEASRGEGFEASLGSFDALEPIVAEHTPVEDAARLRALAAWAVRFAPIVAPDEPDGLLLDVSGCERIYGTESRMLARIGGALAGLGFRPRLAVGPTFGSARALARYGSHPVAAVEAHELRERLAPLPIEALGLEAAAIESLAEIGIEEIGQLLELPRAEIASRFGDEILLEIDRTFGRALEAVVAVRPREPLVVERELAGPTVDPAAIDFVVFDLLRRLADRLEAVELGAVRLELRLARSELAPVDVELVLSRPTRDARHLAELLRPRLERVNLGYGVEGARVAAPRTGPLPASQTVHPASGLPDERLDERHALGCLLDTLASRIGWRGVRRVEALDSHLPERAFRSRSVAEAGAPDEASGGTDDEKRERGPESRESRESREGHESRATDRPTVLFPRPDRIERIDTDETGSPTWFRWRGLEHEVETSIGPERLASEWWREGVTPRDFVTRDYYRVQVGGGRWLWLFCQGGDEDDLGTWYVHGEWR